MKLFYNPPSPYAREVMVVIHEKNLLSRVELCAVDPWTDPADLIALNPIGKVPTLVTDEGVSLTESLMISEYLDQLGTGPSLAGLAGSIRDTQVMARAALAHGVIDAAFNTVLERRRPAQSKCAAWIERQRAAIERTLPHLHPERGRFDLGDITTACALAYLDFRLSEIPWRGSLPPLADWLDEVGERPSMRATRPS
jgi:glutathione S-transferase